MAVFFTFVFSAQADGSVSGWLAENCLLKAAMGYYCLTSSMIDMDMYSFTSITHTYTHARTHAQGSSFCRADHGVRMCCDTDKAKAAYPQIKSIATVNTLNIHYVMNMAFNRYTKCTLRIHSGPKYYNARRRNGNSHYSHS